MGLALGNMLTSPAQVQHLAASPHYPCLAPAWRGVFTNESCLTTNLPFSEWTQVLPNARLCKALLDRITDQAHIIETGTESYRFRRTMDRRRRKG